MSGALVVKNTEETLYSGYLVKGEERKEGTQVAFKDRKKYFVLRCVGQKLLTMTAYKDEKDFRNFGRKGKVVNPDRFIETYNARVKVHKMQMAIKKHRTADILCIVQDKRPLYLEANSRAELDSWYSAFNNILIRLGWKEGNLDEMRPTSYPPTRDTASTDQVNEDRHSTPSVMQGAFDHEPPNSHSSRDVIDGGYIGFRGQNGSPTHDAQTRLHSPPDEDTTKRLSGASPPSTSPPSTPPMSPLVRSRNSKSRRSVPIGHSVDTAHDKEDCQFCCQRHHLVGQDCVYDNIHNVEDVRKWRKDVSIRRERLVDVRQFYSEYVGPPPPAESIRQQRYSAERRRSRSTSDIPLDLKRLQEGYHGHSLWTAPEAETSSEDEQPPQLPARTPSNQSKPRRRTGAYQLPSNLDFPVSPPSSLDQSSQPQPSPPMSPIVQQFLNKHHPLSPHQKENRERKISAPASPPTHTYINAPNFHHSQPPSPGLRKHESMIDVSRRPLPCPTERPSSFVENLQWEQELHEGLPVAVPKKDLEETLALVKIGDYVWIAGKKRGCPDTISSRFHVGDQLRQINDQIVVDVTIAHALFKTTAKEEVTLLVKRMPYGKVFTVRRTSTEVGWGLKMEANKVLDVPKTGPAADAGIKARPEGALSKRLCSWIVTQINNTPISLSCSKDEVKNRLDNSDMEMSIVLQPEDFINKLKSELTENVKFSIDYI